MTSLFYSPATLSAAQSAHGTQAIFDNPKKLLHVSVRMALFGMCVLPLSALANTATSTAANTATQNTAQPISSQPTDSLSRLTQFYERHSTAGARCQGTWVYPNQSLADKLATTNTATNATTNTTTNTTAKHATNEPNNTSNTQTATDDTAAAGTMVAAADYGYYNNHDYAELTGNVQMTQDGQWVNADKVTYNPLTQEAIATGNVSFEQNGQQINAQSVEYNIGTGQAMADGGVVFGEPAKRLNADNTATTPNAGLMGVAQSFSHDAATGQATATDVAFASSGIGAHGYASSLTKPNDHQYLMNGVMFTTCPPDERKWHLDANNITLNTETGRGEARHTTLKIKDVPVFYLPYFNFPIDDRRASGFLVPNAGFNSKDGLELSTPYYFNLAPNYDMTVTPTIFSNRNPKLSAEFRYLTDGFGGGRIDTGYLPKDSRYNDKNRSHLFYDHLWQSSTIANLSATAVYRHVSDNQYLTDFDSLGVSNNALNLSRRLQVNFYNDYLTTDFRVEDFQNLDGVLADGTAITDKDRPYARLPQLHATYRLPKFDGTHWLDNFDIKGVSNGAYFKKSIRDGSEAEKSGVRLYNQVSASYPMVRSWGYITPKAALTHLYASYDEDSLASQNLDKSEGTYSILAPQFSLDTGLHFQKSGTPFGKFTNLGGYQVLSPRLKYLYSPYKEQDDIPIFETTLASISYDQLLADSWFLGYDRLQDLHALTPALNYHWVDADGLTRLDASIAEQYYLRNHKVTLNNDRNFTGKSSGIAWQASAQPWQNLWLDSAGSFTNDYNLNIFILQGRYQPKPDMLFNLGVVNRKQNNELGQVALSAVTASAIFPINQNWRIIAQGQYDYQIDKMMDSLVGVNYEDCCIGVSVYGRHFRNDLNPQAKADTAIMAELRLSGLSSGGRLSKLLSDKVLGYSNVQSAWEQGY